MTVTPLLRLASGRAIVLLLFLATAIRVPLLFLDGFPYDMEVLRDWATIAYTQGLDEVLATPGLDYIAYNYVLWAMAHAYVLVTGTDALGSDQSFLHVVKIPGLLGDLLAITLLYVTTKRLLQPAEQSDLPSTTADLQNAKATRSALLVAALYAFNPTVIYDSAYWGQIDSLITAAIVGSLALVRADRVFIAWATLAVGFLIKPHPIVLAPLLSLVTVATGPMARTFKAWALAAATVAVGLAYFFTSGQGSDVKRIYEEIFSSGNEVSVSAWNLWWPAQSIGEKSPTSEIFGGVTYADASQILLFLAVCVTAVGFIRIKHPFQIFLLAAYLVFSFFVLSMKMHERYLFPTLALLAPVTLMGARWLALYIVVSVSSLLNLNYVFPLPGMEQYAMPLTLQLIITGINIAAYLWLSTQIVAGGVEPRHNRTETSALVRR